MTVVVWIRVLSDSCGVDTSVEDLVVAGPCNGDQCGRREDQGPHAQHCAHPT